ncbi:hypothetical protein [Bradyrhizobium sp. USDA 4454]
MGNYHSSAPIVFVGGKRHTAGVAALPTIHVSEELAALIERAERAMADAQRLMDENDRWRQSVLQQFDHMYEVGAVFRAMRRIQHPQKASSA